MKIRAIIYLIISVILSVLSFYNLFIKEIINQSVVVISLSLLFVCMFIDVNIYKVKK